MKYQKEDNVEDRNDLPVANGSETIENIYNPSQFKKS